MNRCSPETYVDLWMTNRKNTLTRKKIKRNCPQQVKRQNVPTDDVENTNGTNLLFANKPRTFLHRKEREREKEDIVNIWINSYTRRASINNKKANDTLPPSWITDCHKMCKITNEIINFIENTMGNMVSGTDSRKKKFNWGENPERDLPGRSTLTISICKNDGVNESHTEEKNRLIRTLLEMKEKRIKKILQKNEKTPRNLTKLWNLIRTNTLAVRLVRISELFFKWAREELQQMEQRTKNSLQYIRPSIKDMTLTDSMCQKKKKEKKRRGLTSFEDSVDATILWLEDCIKMYGGGLMIANRNGTANKICW